MNTIDRDASAIRTLQRQVADLETEVERLRAALMTAITDIQADHFPDADMYGRTCRICGPQDGHWPCVAQSAADDLKVVLDG